MLSAEEKKAIERMYDLIHTCEVGMAKHGQYDDLFEKDKQAIETVLNLITRLEKENEEKDKQIDIIIDELYKKMKISTNCYIQKREGIEQCLNYKNCKECLKQYFEKKAKGE